MAPVMCGVTQRPCCALYVVSKRSRKPSGCRATEAPTPIEQRLLPSARTRGERSVQSHPSCGAHVRRAHRMAAQEVSDASTVGSPATQTWSMMTAPAARAIAAARGGCFSS